MDGPSARGVLWSGGDDAIVCPSSDAVSCYRYMYCVGGGISIITYTLLKYIRTNVTSLLHDARVG